MLHTMTYPSSVKASAQQHSDFKVVKIDDDIKANLELLKVMHACNKKHGWTLLIAPENVPNKSVLERCSIDSSKLLVIREKHISNLRTVLNEALNNGNFAAVITWTDIATVYQLQTMKLNLTETELFCFSKVQHSDTCTIDNMIF